MLTPAAAIGVWTDAGPPSVCDVRKSPLRPVYHVCHAGHQSRQTELNSSEAVPALLERVFIAITFAYNVHKVRPFLVHKEFTLPRQRQVAHVVLTSPGAHHMSTEAGHCSRMS